MTYTEKELDQFLHGISLSLLSKKSAQHWRYDEETAKEIEWLEALERKVRADKADRKTEPQTEEQQELEAYRKCIKSRSFWDAKHCDDCHFYDDCPFNEREEDALQTYCDTCKHDLWNNPEVCGKCVGSTTLGRKPRMYEPKVADTPQTETQNSNKNSNLTFEKSDCPWK